MICLWNVLSFPYCFATTNYNLLPTTEYLKQWLGDDPACSLCQAPASVRLILTDCITSLTQGLYIRRHDEDPRQLVLILKQRWSTTNAFLQTSSGNVLFTLFVIVGIPPEHHIAPKDKSFVQAAWVWKLTWTWEKKSCVSDQCSDTMFWLDMVLWFTAVNVLCIMGRLYCSNFWGEKSTQNWSLKLPRISGRLSVDVGCKGFVATSIISVLKKNGGEGSLLKQAIKSLSNTAECFGLKGKTATGLKAEDRGVWNRGAYQWNVKKGRGPPDDPDDVPTLPFTPPIPDLPRGLKHQVLLAVP